MPNGHFMLYSVFNPICNWSIDVYLLEEQSCQISSLSHLKLWNLRLSRRGHPDKNKKENKMSSNMRSVSDLTVLDLNWLALSDYWHAKYMMT